MRFGGQTDRFIHRFGPLVHLAAVLVLYALAATALGLAISFGIAFGGAWREAWPVQAGWLRWLVDAVAIGLAFFAAGLSLLVIVPIYNALLPTRVRPYKGGYFSVASVPWALHNGLFYIVRFTFLPFITLTPFGPWFLRGMGMRIGKRAFINTDFISDPCMISVGDDAVIGGSVHLFAHHGGGRHLSIAPVVIGARATIGQSAIVMGDVVVGEGAVVLAHAVLLPGSRVGPGETWGGAPARPLSARTLERLKVLREGRRPA